MANALGTLFGDIANAIRSKTGKEGTMKPAEFPSEILNITTGSSNLRAASGYITVSEENTVDETTTIVHGLGIKPDIMIVAACDVPALTSAEPSHFMASYSMSQALVDKIYETNPDSSTGFLYVRSSGGLNLDGQGNWTGNYTGGYEDLMRNPFYLGFGGPWEITENHVKMGGKTNYTNLTAPALKAGRKLFYLAIGNIL